VVENDRLVGIISLADVSAALNDKQLADMLRRISMPAHAAMR